jgi:hypothetical protein
MPDPKKAVIPGKNQKFHFLIFTRNPLLPQNPLEPEHSERNRIFFKIRFLSDNFMLKALIFKHLLRENQHIYPRREGTQ